MRRALAAGMPPQRIIFSGVGKTRGRAGGGARRRHPSDQCRVDAGAAPAERGRQRRGAGPRGSRSGSTRMSTRMTHAKISTGKKENKFGIDIDEAVAAYRLAGELPGIEPVGLAVHIGSQLTRSRAVSGAPSSGSPSWSSNCARVGLSVARVDLGGGLGIRYHAETPAGADRLCAALVRDIFGSLEVDARVRAGPGAVRPGRTAGRAGGLRQGRAATRRFVIVDAAMNDLIRPALYDAWHDIVPVRLPGAGAVARAGRCRRPGVRNRRHLCRRARSAAACRRRSASRLTQCRRLWRGDELDLQQPAAGARGAGLGRAFCRDPGAAEL